MPTKCSDIHTKSSFFDTFWPSQCINQYEDIFNGHFKDAISIFENASEATLVVSTVGYKIRVV